MNEEQLLESFLERNEHFAQSVQWYQRELKNNPLFAQNYLRVVSLLSSCSQDEVNPKQIHFLALGKSGNVAQLITNMLVSVGIQARFLHPTEALHGDMGALKKNDIIFCISNNGATKEILAFLGMLKNKDYTVLSLTRRPESPLAQQSDVCLPLPPLDEACPVGQAPLTSTITSLVMGQLIVASTMEHRAFSLRSYAQNHPGGTIGTRIFLSVNDIMLKGNKLPLISNCASFADCISAITKFESGAVIVTDSNHKLCGLVTEKNLRVAIQTYESKVFQLKVDDFKTHNPIIGNKSLMAIEAFKIMEQGDRKLNILPIVDDENVPVGLLRLHDLVSAGLSLS